MSALIEEGVAVKWTGTKGAVSGTVKKDPEGVASLYGADGQTGHFFPIEFESKYCDKEIELSGRTNGNKIVTPTTADPYLIIRLENLTEANKLTATVKDTQEEVFELDFSSVTKEGEP